MWAIIIASYIIISYIDINAFSKLKEKGILPFYIALMLISCAVGTASIYVKNMPSPADPIKNFIMSLLGS